MDAAQETRWPCDLCHRSYQRKDLRDRHRRRCIKSNGRSPVSKQKSCMECSRSKLRCDQVYPSCSRCSARGMPCVYSRPQPLSTPTSLEKAPPDSISSMAVDQPTTTTSSGRSNSPQHAEVLLGPEWDIGMDIDGNISDSLYFDELLNPYYFQTDHYPGVFTARNVAKSRPSHDFNQFPDSQGDIPTQYTQTRRFSASSTVSGSRLNFLNTITVRTPQVNLGSLEPSNLLQENSRPSLPDEENATPQPRSQEQSNILDSSSESSIPRPTASPLQLFLQSFTDEKLAHILQSFPKKMIQKDAQIPFLHRQLYNYPEDSSLESPLATASCLIAAHVTKSSVTEEFVYNVLNIERRRLIEEFQSPNTRSASATALLQAMCLYQIVALFDSNIAPTAHTVELYQGFLVKMARQLHRRYLQHPNTSSDWHQWLRYETIRRTFFLVHILNVLSSRMKIQKSVFFEPLDDDFIRHAPLPGSNDLWTATSAEQWAAMMAREHSNVTTVDIVQADHLVRSRPDGPRYEELWNRLSELDELAKMVVACSVS